MPNTAARLQQTQSATQFAAIVMLNTGWRNAPAGDLPQSAIKTVGIFSTEREAWQAAKTAAQANRDSIGFYVEEAE